MTLKGIVRSLEFINVPLGRINENDKTDYRRFLLKNTLGYELEVLSLGATVLAIRVSFSSLLLSFESRQCLSLNRGALQRKIRRAPTLF